MKIKEIIINTGKHFKKICVHKYWVFHYCSMCGIKWRGIKHDMSKFSPTEFFESIKYYKGDSSPIDECKRINGVSIAWMHHKGRNDHHFEYWQQNFINGGEPVEMPYKCVLELICDYLAAARAYLGNNFSYINEYKWFIDRISNNPRISMHFRNQIFIYFVFEHLATLEHEYYINQIYDYSVEDSICHYLSTGLKNQYELSYQYSYIEFMRTRKQLESREWVK